MTVHAISNASIGPGSERPPADNPTGGVSTIPFGLYIDSDTGTVYETTGEQWVQIGQLPAGTSFPGVTSDGMNGVKAQNFTAYPTTPDPIEGPVVTAVSANDNSVSALPAGDYQYSLAYVDENFNFTDTVGVSTVTLDGTQIVQLTPPASKPASVPWVIYGRLAIDGFYTVSAPIDPAIPFLDFGPEAAVHAGTLVSTYNQTFPTATFGGTEINGSALVKTALSEWGVTPLFAQPILTASFTDTQAQLTELIGVLASKGMVLDRRA